MVAEVLDFFFLGMLFRAVAKDYHRTDHLPTGIMNWSRRILDWRFTAVLSDEQGMVGELHDGFSGKNLLHRALSRLSGVFIDDSKYRFKIQPNCLFLTPAGNALRNWVHKFDFAIPVRGYDPIAHRDERGMELFVVLPDLFFVSLKPIHIGYNPLDGLYPATGPIYNLPTLRDPFLSAILSNDKIFLVKDRALLDNHGPSFAQIGPKGMINETLKTHHRIVEQCLRLVAGDLATPVADILHSPVLVEVASINHARDVGHQSRMLALALTQQGLLLSRLHHESV